MSPMRIHYENNNKNNNDQEENEVLNIVLTQVDYHSGVNNIQIKDDDSIIREDDDDGGMINDSIIYTNLTQTTV